MTQIIAPDPSLPADAFPVVFLAGSIEMGVAEEWQQRMGSALEQAGRNVYVCNPRRTHWDSSWEQSIDNPLFVEQVNWELDHLARADLAVFYFQPQTKSPITLMELGHRLASQKPHQHTVVCCPPGFWRKGNVDILCQRHDVTVFDRFEDFLMHSAQWLAAHSLDGPYVAPSV